MIQWLPDGKYPDGPNPRSVLCAHLKNAKCHLFQRPVRALRRHLQRYSGWCRLQEFQMLLGGCRIPRLFVPLGRRWQLRLMLLDRERLFL